MIYYENIENFYGIGKSFKKTTGDIKDTAKKTGDTIEKTASKTGDTIEKTASKTGDTIEKTASKTGDTIEKTANKTGDVIKKTGTTALKGSETTFGKVKDFSKTALNSSLNFLEKYWGYIKIVFYTLVVFFVLFLLGKAYNFYKASSTILSSGTSMLKGMNNQSSQLNMTNEDIINLANTFLNNKNIPK